MPGDAASGVSPQSRYPAHPPVRRIVIWSAVTMLSLTACTATGSATPPPSAPLATTGPGAPLGVVSEPFRLVALGDSNGAPIVVGQNYRYLRAYSATRRLVREGAIGRIGSVTAHIYNQPSKAPASLAGVGNSVLWEVAIHRIDALAYVLDRQITGVMARSFSSPGSELPPGSSLQAMLTLERDVHAVLTATYESRGHERFERGQEFYQRLTGEKGYFDTRIVFVDETGPKDRRVKRLAMMDQDGQNLRLLTNGDALVLTPRFSPTSQEITFMSFDNDRPRVYLLNIETGQKEIVGDFPGMTFAPRFSPNGQLIIMSLQQGGNSNIFLMDLRSRRTRQLTNTPAIDTAPCYSPDGRRIVFESDRSGTQQLYVMDGDGSFQQRISRGEGSYSTPVWSPRGDLIAFTKQLGGRFLIGVMHPDGSNERILTEGFHNEGPTWSPNGRVLMFFRESPGERGGPRLYTVDLTGYNERIVATPSFGSDPAWSPLIN